MRKITDHCLLFNPTIFLLRIKQNLWKQFDFKATLQQISTFLLIASLAPTLRYLENGLSAVGILLMSSHSKVVATFVRKQSDDLIVSRSISWYTIFIQLAKFFCEHSYLVYLCIIIVEYDMRPLRQIERHADGNRNGQQKKTSKQTNKKTATLSCFEFSSHGISLFFSESTDLNG